MDIFAKGSGWDTEEARTWLKPGNLESTHPKKAKKRRNISHREARETVAILKTMQFIRMSEELDELGCCQYEIKCDLRGFIKQDPMFVKHCKKLAKEKQFTASHEVLQMINFKFLKNSHLSNGTSYQTSLPNL